jgi:hypothetical protein
MASPVWNRRRLLQGAAVVAAGITTPGLSGTAHAQQRGAADLVLHGGRVLTLNRGFRIAEALAIRNGTVIHVGDNRSVRQFIGRRTERVAALVARP